MRVRLLSLAIASLLVGGCSEKVSEYAVEKAIEKAGGEHADVDISKGGEKIEVTIKDAKTGKTATYQASAGGDIDFPEEFPAPFVAYPGASMCACVSVLCASIQFI